MAIPFDFSFCIYRCWQQPARKVVARTQSPETEWVSLLHCESGIFLKIILHNCRRRFHSARKELPSCEKNERNVFGLWKLAKTFKPLMGTVCKYEAYCFRPVQSSVASRKLSLWQKKKKKSLNLWHWKINCKRTGNSSRELSASH